MSTTLTAAANGSAPRSRPASSSRGLRATVREFFEQYNWDGRAIAPQPLSSGSTGAPPALSLTLSVQRYFDAFPWEGHPTIAAPTTPVLSLDDMMQSLEEPTGNSEITLDDFSGLFG